MQLHNLQEQLGCRVVQALPSPAHHFLPLLSSAVSKSFAKGQKGDGAGTVCTLA